MTWICEMLAVATITWINSLASSFLFAFILLQAQIPPIIPCIYTYKYIYTHISERKCARPFWLPWVFSLISVLLLFQKRLSLTVNWMCFEPKACYHAVLHQDSSPLLKWPKWHRYLNWIPEVFKAFFYSLTRGVHIHNPKCLGHANICRAHAK